MNIISQPVVDDLAGELRRSAESFVARESGTQRARQWRGVLPGHDRAIWDRLAALGWLGIHIPEEFGGLGLGLAESASLAEVFATSVMPEPFAAAAVLATIVLVEGENAELKRRLLPQIASGKLLPALAWQERADRFDPEDVTVTARSAGDRIILSGAKNFIAGAGDADGFIVSARHKSGLSLMWVPRGVPGVSVAFTPLVDGTFAAGLSLHDAEISEADILCTGFATARAALSKAIDCATITAGAELLGLASRAFSLTLDYLRTRQQFGQFIGSFQALQHRAVDCHTQIQLASAVLEEAIAAGPAERSRMASRIKARAGEAASLVMREAIQMHGALGFTDESDVGLYVKRSIVLNAWLGGVRHHRRRFAALAPVSGGARPRREPLEIPERRRALPGDTDWNAVADADFRALVRSFIEENYPDDLRYLPRRVRWSEVRDWNLKLSERGWIAPGWPREWGGMELSPAKQMIFLDEFERWGVGRAPDQGVRQLGPVLLKYGSEEQKRFYLPKIVSCEHIWSQGYSEPNAGSDLANVATTATPDGDDFIIRGQKIWTSMAMDSTHIYVLCRTDSDAKKQAGISFLMLDLGLPGITVRPIRDIAGNEEFCEVFFDDVRVPKANLVGGINRGWTVAKAVLDFERLGIGSPRRPMIALNRLTSLARRLGLFDDPGFLDEFTRLRLDILDNGSLFARFAGSASDGVLGPDVSILKIFGMETFQRVSEFTLDCAGAYGAVAGDIDSGDEPIELMTPYFMSRLATIGGGSSEILRNLIAKRVLNLP